MTSHYQWQHDGNLINPLSVYCQSNKYQDYQADRFSFVLTSETLTDFLLHVSFVTRAHPQGGYKYKTQPAAAGSELFSRKAQYTGNKWQITFALSDLIVTFVLVLQNHFSWSKSNTEGPYPLVIGRSLGLILDLVAHWLPGHWQAVEMGHLQRAHLPHLWPGSFLHALVR